jgi:hypothetical protein
MQKMAIRVRKCELERNTKIKGDISLTWTYFLLPSIKFKKKVFVTICLYILYSENAKSIHCAPIIRSVQIKLKS